MQMYCKNKLAVHQTKGKLLITLIWVVTANLFLQRQSHNKYSSADSKLKESDSTFMVWKGKIKVKDASRIEFLKIFWYITAKVYYQCSRMSENVSCFKLKNV